MAARVLVGLACFVLALLGVRSASAAPQWRPPSGAPVVAEPARPELPLRSCDLREPVCVHAPAAIAPEVLTRVRERFADAYGLVVETLRVPPPLSDGPAGGDPRFDVYVVPDALGEGVFVARDALDRIVDRDAAPAFVLVSERLAETGGCTLRAAVATSLVRASAAGLDLAETENVVEGFARRVAEVVAPCPTLERARLEAVQQTPWRAMASSPTGPELFARALDLEKGKGFAAVVPASLSMATNHFGIVIPEPLDEVGPAHFHNAPSVLDVLGVTLSDAGSSLDEAFLDYATARALAPVPPAWEWEVPVSTLPRRFAIRRAIEPTGATFFAIDLDASPAGDAIEIDLAWDQGSRFVWRLLEIGKNGERLPDVRPAILETARKVTIEARHLANVKRLILVGVNMGDPKHPFRPDDPPSPPRGYEAGVYTGG